MGFGCRTGVVLDTGTWWCGGVVVVWSWCSFGGVLVCWYRTGNNGHVVV